MSFPFYWWNSHYACRKSGKDVNEDIYYKYCRNYDYDDCPIYKGQDSGGCFLTSACVEAMGLPDDCYELTILRNFRDTYLAKQVSGKSEIAHYYHVAPVIVAHIRKRVDRVVIFEKIYNELVLPCVKMIEASKLSDAHRHYRDYVNMLEKQFITL